MKTYVAESQSLHFVDFVLNAIPSSLVQAFVGGDILPVLVVSVLFGLALLRVRDTAAPLLNLIEQLGDTLFAMVGLIVRVAPIGAFGAMAFTIGRYGLATLLSLAKLMAAVYLTCFLFIVIVLGSIAAASGFSLLEVHPLHQGRDPAGARYFLVRVGAAADDGQAGAARVRSVGRRSGRPDRLLVQPRWHLDLHDDRSRLRRPGARRPSWLARVRRRCSASCS